MSLHSKSVQKRAEGDSNSFWAAVRSQLQLDSDRGLAKLIGLDQAALSRARKSIDPFDQITSEKQQRLLAELAKTFAQPRQMREWLKQAGWVVTAEQSVWLDRHFRRHQKMIFLRQLTEFYEPRAALEAEIMEHVRPTQVPYEQRRIARSGVVLSGLRGQGKTTLALGALNSYPALEEEFPDGVYFLDCHRQATEQCLEAFAVELGLDLSALTADQRLTAVRKVARDKALLLVLDDVEDVQTIQSFFDVLGSCISSRLLITTYQRLTEAELKRLRLHKLDLPELTPQEGKQLVARILPQPIPRAEQASLERLLKRIGGHPLALTILIGLRDDTQSTWNDLLQMLEQSALSALEYPDATDKEGSVRLCFELVYHRLVEQHPQAAAVFRALGVFGGARGLIGLLCEVAELSESVETTLYQLVRYNLLSVERGTAGTQRIWHTHTLLRDFAVSKLHEQPTEERACQQRFMMVLMPELHRLQATDRQKPAIDWETKLLIEVAMCYRLVDRLEDAAQVVASATVRAKLNNPYTPPELWARICATQAEVALALGNVEEALQNFVRAETAYEQAGWHMYVAQMKTRQAACLLHKCRVAEALDLLYQARAFFSDLHWPLENLELVVGCYCCAFLLQENQAAAQAELDHWEELLSDYTGLDSTVRYANLWRYRGALAEYQQHYAMAMALSHYQQSLAFWHQVTASESYQRIVQDRIAAVRAHLAE